MDNEYIVPRIRQELLYREIDNNGNKSFLLYDPNEYALQPIELPIEFLSLLRLLDGKITKSRLMEFIKIKTQSPEEYDPITQIIGILDTLGYLETQTFKTIKEENDKYKNSKVRPAVCSGSTYSEDPDNLEIEINNILSSAGAANIKPGAKGIIVPHIDFRIGTEAHQAYSSAYNSIRGTEADLFVIFGTAHYGNSDLFMLCDKDYETPFGTVKTDREIIEQLIREIPELKIDNMAHKNEHSIELQLVMIQHLFGNIDYSILPILTGSFFDFILKNESPAKNKKFCQFTDKLREIIIGSGKKPIYIASGDLAHIGRKFDDNFDAEPELENLVKEDTELIDRLEELDSEGFYYCIAKVNDKRKICGLPPIYTLMHTFEPRTAKFLKYAQWNETEEGSAVSFASMAFYE